MARLFRAFFYKISKDITFRITLIIAVGMAVFTTLLYYILGNSLKEAFAEQYGEELAGGIKALSGPSMLLSSFSPAQNFGIALPINLISYTYLEFSQGTIRNKIIAGHSKFKIYSSLYLTGLVFTFILLFAYVGLCTGIGSIFGGFDAHGYSLVGMGSLSKVSPEFITKFFIVAVLVYVSIVSFTIFTITLFRNMGPSIPVIVLAVMLLYMVPYIVSTMNGMQEAMTGGAQAATSAMNTSVMSTSMIEGSTSLAEASTATTNSGGSMDTFMNLLKVLDPLTGLAIVETENGVATMNDLTFYGAIGSNIAYATIFFFGGAYIFKKRDIK